MPRAKNWKKKDKCNLYLKISNYSFKIFRELKRDSRLRSRRLCRRIKHISWSCRGKDRVGIGCSWRQNCEIAEGGKALFIKADTVKWHFFFQIKMLKHNKCTVHLTSSMLRMQPNHLPAQNRLPSSNWFVGVVLQQKRGCAFERVCVCVCLSPQGQKHYRKWGFWH